MPFDDAIRGEKTSAVDRLREVTIYTDGACTGNPGPGGYAAVLICAEKRKEIVGGYRRTTNNRMELIAAIVGLETLRYRCRVTLKSDSSYVCNGIARGWAKKWRASGWRKADRAPVANVDLWTRLLALEQVHDLTLVWLRGHVGDEENERCDSLAVKAAKQPDLPPDEEYENAGSRPYHR